MTANFHPRYSYVFIIRLDIYNDLLRDIISERWKNFHSQNVKYHNDTVNTKLMFVIGENLENRFTVETLENNGHFSSLYVTLSQLINLNKNRTYFIISKGTTFTNFYNIMVLLER